MIYQKYIILWGSTTTHNQKGEVFPSIIKKYFLKSLDKNEEVYNLEHYGQPAKGNKQN